MPSLKKSDYTIKPRQSLGKTVFELKSRGISIGFFKTQSKAEQTRDNLIEALKLSFKFGKKGFKLLFGKKPVFKKPKKNKRRKK